MLQLVVGRESGDTSDVRNLRSVAVGLLVGPGVGCRISRKSGLRGVNLVGKLGRTTPGKSRLQRGPGLSRSLHLLPGRMYIGVEGNLPGDDPRCRGRCFVFSSKLRHGYAVILASLVLAIACERPETVTRDGSAELAVEPAEEPGVAFATADVNCKDGDTFRVEVDNATSVSISYNDDGSIHEYEMENDEGDKATVNCEANSCTGTTGDGKCTKQS